MRVESFSHVSITVTDLARARRFYGELLRLEEIPRPKHLAWPGVWYRAGTTPIHLSSKAVTDPPSARHFCLWVEEVKDAASEIAAAGYPVVWSEHRIPGIDRFFTNDPDGNRIEVQGPSGTVYAA
jgi:catechol 2,3-dioxygenase-like lactoylglutathione lyase family enzyme